MSAPAVDMKRHYSGGPSWQYCYTYANPAEVGPRQPLQLQFWLPKGRKGGSWFHATPGESFPGARPGCFRRVNPSKKHADKLAHSIGAVKPCGYNRSAETVKEAYLYWARRAGLAVVHVFKGDGYAIAAARTAFGFEAVEADPDDFIGDAPADEYDCYGDWDHDGAEVPNHA